MDAPEVSVIHHERPKLGRASLSTLIHVAMTAREEAGETQQASVASGFSEARSLPRQVGRRVLLKLLAKGGMGEVYLATTFGLDGAERPQVVKTVRRDHMHDGSFLARFLDEARVQSQLNHPNVVQVLEAGTDDDGEPFTAFEHIEGRSLAEVRARSAQLGIRISWPEATAIALEIAQGLAHVHDRAGSDGKPLGIVHRDLSPQNVMVGYAGEVKLIDFGTARGENRRCHTVAGVVFAKPGYVAPEIARHEVGDGRIDLYALGVMLWELAAGRRLLDGDPQRHLEEVAEGRFSIPKLAPRIGTPPELDVAITKLTANLPTDRYTSAAHAAADLAKLLMRAPTGPAGERSVRTRVGAIMKSLFVSEPARSRSEFARLIVTAKETLGDAIATPPASSGMRVASVDPSLFPGTSYRLGAKIGEGASGVVHEAEHIELGRKVALKILDPQAASSGDALERFRREARAVAKLSHPNVAFLHDFGRTSDGRVFLAMELLSGRTLGEELAQREKTAEPFSWREAAKIGIAAANALGAAHNAGIVHRDLKPENLFLTDRGVLKLLDFGIALAKSDAVGEENPHKGFAIFGTPEYMAPEQVRGEPVDARCDLYALGCVLYELTTGERPFSGTSSVVVMTKHLRENPAPPSERAPARMISPAFDAVVRRCMAKEASARYASALELEMALDSLLAKKERPKSRRATFGAVGLALALPLMTWTVLRSQQEIGVDSNAALAPVSPPTLDSAVIAEPQAPASSPAPVTTPLAASAQLADSTIRTSPAAQRADRSAPGGATHKRPEKVHTAQTKERDRTPGIERASVRRNGTPRLER